MVQDNVLQQLWQHCCSCVAFLARCDLRREICLCFGWRLSHQRRQNRGVGRLTLLAACVGIQIHEGSSTSWRKMLVFYWLAEHATMFLHLLFGSDPVRQNCLQDQPSMLLHDEVVEDCEQARAFPSHFAGGDGMRPDLEHHALNRRCAFRPEWRGYLGWILCCYQKPRWKWRREVNTWVIKSFNPA